jgi:Amidase
MPDTGICFLPAPELALRIRGRELSAAEVMEAHLEQVERVNPRVNAIVTLLPGRALEEARAADERLARGEEIGLLHGLPVAHKDLVPTRGVRTTFGSLVNKDHVPDQGALIVERLREAGPIYNYKQVFEDPHSSARDDGGDGSPGRGDGEGARHPRQVERDPRKDPARSTAAR